MRGAAPTGRLAPSPTGLLHLGHARTFLLAWWHLRSRGGRVILRIENLDAGRVVASATGALVRDLEWLGLDWEGPPVLQSTRRAAHADAAARLAALGVAYPCVCSRADVLLAQSAPHAGTEGPPYPGTCRDRYATLDDARARSRRPAGLRFRVPPGRVTPDEAFAAPASTDVSLDSGDFLVARRDGGASYQLAVVVDDAMDGVTEILRGDDLLPSAARQTLLRRALGLPEPRGYHVPLVVDSGGRRLAKRSDSLALARLRDGGVDPRAIVTWAAQSAGLDVRELATASEVTPTFTLERLPRTPVVTPELEALLAASGR